MRLPFRVSVKVSVKALHIVSLVVQPEPTYDEKPWGFFGVLDRDPKIRVLYGFAV